MGISGIKILDNALDTEYHNLVKNVIESDHFPWYYKPGIDFKDDGKFQFTHTLFDDGAPKSSLYENLQPILNLLGAKTIIRIKANLITRTNDIVENSFHIDYPNCKTAIYYVNTNNGYTLFETKEKINSIENRIVIFDSNIMHAGTSCSDNDTRIVINFNYV